jgi:hypothetical protein
LTPLRGALESKPGAGEEAGFGPDFNRLPVGRFLESSQESFGKDGFIPLDFFASKDIFLKLPSGND